MIVLSCIWSSYIFAQDITQSVAIYKQSKAEIFKIEENIAQYKVQLGQINDNIRALSNNKNNLQKEISKLQNLLNTKQRQINNMQSNIKSNLMRTKQTLIKNLPNLKENTEQYNLAKTQIDNLSAVDKSISDINKLDKQIRNINRKLKISQARAQNKKQNSANIIATEDAKVKNIQSELINLKMSLGVN